MSNILTIKDLSFKYEKDNIFDLFNLNVKRGELIYIISPNKSGKSTLIKLFDEYPYSGDILIDNLQICRSNMTKIRQRLKLIDINAVSECKLKNIVDKINELSGDNDDIRKDYQLLNISDNDFRKLNILEKIKVSVFINLINNPDLLIIESVLEYLDNTDKNIMYSLIKKYNRKNKTTIIILNNKSYGMIYCKRIILLNMGNILFDGSLKDVEKNDDVFNDLSIELPFMLDLSIKLKLYDLIDNIYTDEKRMIKEIWKK